MATGISNPSSSATFSRSFISSKVSIWILAPSFAAVTKDSYGLYGPLYIISLPSIPNSLAFSYSNSLTTSAIAPSW